MRRWKAHRGKIASLSFSRDGQLLASVTGNGRDIFIWDATAGELVRQLAVEDAEGKASYARALGVAFGSHTDLLAVTRQHWLEVWDAATWERVAEYRQPENLAYCYEVAIGPGLDPWIVCSASGSIGAFFLEARTLCRHGAWPSANASQLTLSANGDELATHSIDTLVVRAPETGRVTQSFEHKRSNYAGPVRFSPDSSRLAFCYTKTIESHPATLDDPENVIRYVGHTDKVWMLRYTPDGRTLISASSDGTVRTWEAATGLEKRCFDMKIGKIAAADVSPDGSIAAVGGATGDIVVWDLE